MTQIIDENWKQAATQEGVDYDAVQKAFMDQSYGVVANKAKVLFQDPFRLGFEIVHRNEKATKMVGIFAFRVNGNLLYAPTFFVNGEIKPADMLYRADVKRFVGLTEDWCNRLVRGVGEQAGECVPKNRTRQSDAYMDRLAYPQRVKYAAFDDPEMKKAADEVVKGAEDGTIWFELLKHASEVLKTEKLLPKVIDHGGPEVLEKLASLLENHEGAQRFLVENYTREELETMDSFVEKQASCLDHRPAIVLNMDPGMAKSASARESIFDKGYELVDNRPEDALNAVVEEVGDGTIKELKACTKANVLLDNGSITEAALFKYDYGMLSRLRHPEEQHYRSVESPNRPGRPERVYFPDTKELCCVGYNQEVFGDELIDQDLDMGECGAMDLEVGKQYVMISKETNSISDLFTVVSCAPDGESVKIVITNHYGSEDCLCYAPNRIAGQAGYISDEALFVEVKCEVREKDYESLKPKCERVLMNGKAIDQWIRTAGGVTSSREVRVTPNKNLGTFDITHTEKGTDLHPGGVIKVARDLGMLEAHLKIAEDFEIHVDKAGEILDKAVDRDVTYRVFDSLNKSAYLTRPQGMQAWIQSYDPEIQVRMDSPQQQVLSTFTPQRSVQNSRYGDVYQRVPAQNSDDMEDLLPRDAVMSKSPEELAHMSQELGLPHIFDHEIVGQLATSTHNIVDQIKKYIPNIESGADSYFRILFLLRYRPGDFEEIYGQDDLLEFEQDLTDVAQSASENLLNLLNRFDPEQYSQST